jgi:hypothetical protein
VLQIKVAEPSDFLEPETIALPFILQIVITNGQINHFDGLLIRSEADLVDGPPVEWLEREWP